MLGEISKLKIAPNPVKDLLGVDLADFVQEQGLEIQLFSAQGALIYSQNVDSLVSQHSIDVRTIPAGLYFIRLNNSAGALAHEKVVIQR